MRRPRFDTDAAIWFAVAYMAAAFGLLPVMMGILATTGRGLDKWGYLAANAGVLVTAYAVTTALLVRAHPARRFGDVVATFYVLQSGVAFALAVLQFIGAPRTVLTVLASLLAPLTFGAVQITAVTPLALAEPDVGAIVGVCAGFLIGRTVLRASGRPVGIQAEAVVTPMRLPSSTEGDTIDTHT